MNKSIFVLIVCLFNFTMLNAQDVTRKNILNNAAKSFEAESRASFSKAIIKSSERGWPLEYQSSNNRHSSLVGVDQFGLPIYLTTFADPVQAITVNTNQLWPGGSSGFNLSGSSDSITNRIGVWDESSPRLTHVEFAGRL